MRAILQVLVLPLLRSDLLQALTNTNVVSTVHVDLVIPGVVSMAVHPSWS
jgi:hypothetical protein